MGEVLDDISGKEPLYLAKKFKAQYTAVKEIPVPVIGVGAVYGSYQTAEIMLQLKSVIFRFSKVLTIYSRDGLTETGAFCISPAEMQNLSFLGHDNGDGTTDWYTSDGTLDSCTETPCDDDDE